MKPAVKGSISIFVLGILAILTYHFLRPLLFERFLRETSDTRGSQTIRIAGDNYLGYWFITSPNMRKEAPRQGFVVDFHDDGGAYEERLQKFSEGEYDAIVLPVNSYLEHGMQYKYPGVIVASISESKGADGIVAFGDKFPSDKVTDLNDPDLKVVYTSKSPSSFLLDLTIANFDLFNLANTDNWRMEVGSSEEVYEMAKRGEGDVFVLWEPDLSKALELPGMKYIWGSDKFSGYIIDVFVFSREFLEDNHQLVVSFFNTYFRDMANYANNRERMIEEMSQSTGVKNTIIEPMLDKIEWFDLNENASLQFGLTSQVGDASGDRLISTIIACTDVHLQTGVYDHDPLGGNPYMITNSTVLEELRNMTVASVFTAGSKPVDFTTLEEDEWNNLREVGALRIEPISFQAGNNLLSVEGKEKVDTTAQLLLNQYPGYRVVVRGHTGPGENEEANVKLSSDRAQSVKQYMITVHGIDSDRLLAKGMGSERPPPQKPGESPRRYRSRLARVEFVLFEANIL